MLFWGILSLTVVILEIAALLIIDFDYWQNYWQNVWQKWKELAHRVFGREGCQQGFGGRLGAVC